VGRFQTTQRLGKELEPAVYLMDLFNRYANPFGVHAVGFTFTNLDSPTLLANQTIHEVTEAKFAVIEWSGSLDFNILARINTFFQRIKLMQSYGEIGSKLDVKASEKLKKAIAAELDIKDPEEEEGKKIVNGEDKTSENAQG
jgi:hypothetical protein